jgi:hypothetical protein
MTAVTATRKTFDTAEFKAAHGKQPRGTGMWIFATRQAVQAARGTGEMPAETFTCNGTFTQARAAAPAGEWVVMS